MVDNLHSDILTEGRQFGGGVVHLTPQDFEELLIGLGRRKAECTTACRLLLNGFNFTVSPGRGLTVVVDDHYRKRVKELVHLPQYSLLDAINYETISGENLRCLLLYLEIAK